MRDIPLEEIRAEVLQTFEGLRSDSIFSAPNINRAEYVYGLIDKIKSEKVQIVDNGEVVTDRFIRFLDTLIKDPISKELLFSLVPTTREEFLTLKYPYTMKPSIIQTNSKFYYIRYDLDCVNIAKISFSSKSERHYFIEFVEMHPKYSSIGFLPDIIKDALTSEFGLTSFELSPKVFGIKGTPLPFEEVNAVNGL